MDKLFNDICYEVLSHYLHFPDVADTFKSINDGINHLRNYPLNDFDFQYKRGEIISYILKARMDNFIYQYHETNKVLALSPIGKTLYQDTRNELYVQLDIEVSMLKLKGIYQTIKHLYPEVNDDALSGELLQNDMTVFARYGLQ